MSRSNLGDNILGGEILRPVRGAYITSTLALALLINLIPLPGWLASAIGGPVRSGACSARRSKSSTITAGERPLTRSRRAATASAWRSASRL